LLHQPIFFITNEESVRSQAVSETKSLFSADTFWMAILDQAIYYLDHHDETSFFQEMPWQMRQYIGTNRYIRFSGDCQSALSISEED